MCRQVSDMIINLEELNSNIKENIEINEVVEFDDELIENSSIIKLDKIKFNGQIFKDLSDEFILKGVLEGIMYVEDSINLEEVDYPFSIEIDENIEENLENNQNSIDIISILWQNIVLEVPLRYTKVEDFSSYSGDGWRLISEDKVNTNNPFLELKEKFKEE